MTTKLPEFMEVLARQRGYKAGVAAATALTTTRTDTFVPQPLPSNIKPEGISDKEFDVMSEVHSLLKDATEHERKVILRKLEKDARKAKRVHQRENAALRQRQASIRRAIDALDEVDKKVNASALRLEKPERPSFPDLRRAVSHGEAIYYDETVDEPGRSDELNRKWEKGIFRHANHFVVEHDWAGALARADLGEFKLPYEICAFDIRVNGLSAVGFAFQDGADKIGFNIAVKSSLGWMLPPPLTVTLLDDEALATKRDGIIELARFVALQVRAVSIALDAEIAVSEVTRAPHSGKAKDGKTLPPTSYHVVSLARRKRAAPRPDAEPTGRHVRLHFRRGHWRHFEASKTWIKWMLCGDPDLGFVDKHYRL